MAYDKVIDSAKLDADLTTVADAIREKGGTSETLSFPDGFTEAIKAIESGVGGDDSWANRIAGSGSIKWPSGITEIPAGLFSNVKTNGFVFDELPDSVEVIGKEAFYASYVYALNFTKLPANLITIGDNSFRSKYFEFSVIPSGVKSIGESAFYYNSRLKAITFKGIPTKIAADAFGQCGNLLTINVPWAEGAVANAPWGATKATINYNYTGG